MSAVGRPEAYACCGAGNDRIQETASVVDDIRRPFVMSVRQIPLEGSGLDGVNRQDGNSDRVPAQRVFVRTRNPSAGFLDRGGEFRGGTRRLSHPALRRAEPL